MNKLLNDIKELPEFYKLLAFLLAAISFIFVPPLFSSIDYFHAIDDWISIALSVFLIALMVVCVLNRLKESKNES